MPSKKPKLVNKQAQKRLDGKCRFCPVADYALLQTHRIHEGADGGGYTQRNTVTCCANCHCRIHDGQIRIDRYYFSTSGRWLLHYWEDGQERWN